MSVDIAAVRALSPALVPLSARMVVVDDRRDRELQRHGREVRERTQHHLVGHRVVLRYMGASVQSFA